MKTRGILIVVSGFAGSGKGTLMKEILEQYDNYALSISATTRKPRGTEMDGREYFFKTTEEFKKMIAEGRYHNYGKEYFQVVLSAIYGEGEKKDESFGRRPEMSGM